jgi:preprotein translocase subunit SecA
MKQLLTKIFGDESTKFLKGTRKVIEQINALESEISALADADFPIETEKLKKQYAEGMMLDEILPRAFALVREAGKRTLGERHYDVQLVGGITLHMGKIAEMRTGEGKTLVATLPAYLNALTGRGVHVVTVNDYLARRDGELMGQVYHFLGLSVGIINDGFKSYLYDQTIEPTPEIDEVEQYKVLPEFLRPVSKREAYAADITYGTNTQFGFDYLRDNMQTNINNIVGRGYAYAIVDEVDSVLIDEARVPLIMSAPAEHNDELYKRFASLAKTFTTGTDYTVDEKQRAIQITDVGIDKAEKFLNIDNLYTAENTKFIHHLENAVRAEGLFHNNKEYIVRGGEVLIVDQFTGRILDGRRYNDGLHQALEAKEGVEIKEESRTAASITYQNYFKLYGKISGMTGTGKTSEEEFYKVYGLEVIQIPTHRDVARIDQQDLIYQTRVGKYKALAKRVRALYDKGQPVLIGTVSIEDNEVISSYLKNEGIPHEVLNAKNHDREAEIIAQAGREKSVVVATNMAGRGVDIKLGGVPFEQSAYERIKSLGGLYVIGTERHEARRIDNQLRGRSGRQGDPGETQFYVSLEDDLVRVFGGDRVAGMIGKMGLPEDEAIQHSFISKQLEGAQAKIEGFHFDGRKNTLSYDDVLSTQRNSVYDRRHKILSGDQGYIASVQDSLLDRLNDDEKSLFQNKQEILGTEQWNNVFLQVILSTLDRLWMDHLDAMEHARSAVNLRGYAQRDPLVEYKREGLQMFRGLEENLMTQVSHIMTHLDTDAILGNTQVVAVSPMEQVIKSTGVSLGKKYGANERVIIVKGSEEMEVKYKKIDQYLADGWTIKE